jgi:hypothetical protein
MIWDSSKATVYINSLSGLQSHPSETANLISDRCDNLFTPHVLCADSYERRTEPEPKLCLKLKEPDTAVIETEKIL